MSYQKKIYFTSNKWLLESIISLSFFSFNCIFSQEIANNSSLFEYSRIINETNSYYKQIIKKPLDSKLPKKITASYISHYVYNIGHSNIDNNGRFYASGRNNSLQSFRLSLNYKYLFIELEPYELYIKNSNNGLNANSPYRFLNNFSRLNFDRERGLKNSQIVLHYKGFGFGYGYINQWWGPGIHSSLILSSNSPDIKTFSFGTFREISFNKFSIYSKMILSEFSTDIASYKTANDPYDIFISGISTYIKFFSDPIITIGINRLILSNNYPGYLSNTQLKSWGIQDAAKSVFQPIFGQSNRGAIQTVIGSSGFDPWDQTMSGFINLNFPKDLLEFYVEIASDDRRANLSDFLAHWDHTIGYLIGFNKYIPLQNSLFFIRGEYVNTLPSNTTNPKFYRGSPNLDNFYNNSIYDYSTYRGRRIAAHSGSSSDDLILYVGLKSSKNLFIFSYNYERHGVKSTKFPELKYELALSINHQIANKHNLFIRFENENIHNFSFVEDNISKSNFIWLGYSFTIN